MRIAPHRRRTLGAVAFASALALVSCQPRSGGEPGKGPAPVSLAPENVAVVEEMTLQSGPEISGTLRARRAGSLRAEVQGAVLEVVAREGDRVEKGQVLARIDDSALADAALAARLGVSAARNGLALVESNAARSRTLAEAGAFSPQQAEQADAALEAGKAVLADAEARLALASLQQRKTRVRAPFAGVVSERAVSPGDVVSPGAPLFTVIDPSRLEFEAAVPAAQVGQLVAGAEVQFRVTGFGSGFTGKVDRVNPSVDPATGQVRLYVDVPNEDGKLIAGLYAQGRVASARRTAPSAPDGAVDLSTSPPTVLRVTGSRVERVPVEIALRDDVAGAVAFDAGVRVGDLLVLGSARAALAEGAAVEVARPARRSAEGPAVPAGKAN
jgi:RND family efflux transporter MFP subunit